MGSTATVPRLCVLAAMSMALIAACSSRSDDRGSGPPTTAAGPSGTAGGAPGTVGAGPETEPSAVTVFAAGEDGVDTFRIPAVTVTTAGTVLAFAEARTVSALDGDPHQLVVRRSEDGGRTWGAVQTVVPYDEATGCSPSDPAPVAVTVGDDAGDVVLLYRSCRSGVALPGVVRSSDDGRTWSAAITTAVATDDGRIPSGTIGTGPGHGVELRGGAHAGRLVVPAHGPLDGTTHVFLLLSDDGGRTWRIGASAPEPPGGTPDIDEPAVAEAVDGSLLVSTRSAAGGRTQARSVDGGASFADLGGGVALEHRAELTNPVVQGSLLTLEGRGVSVFVSPSDPVDRRGLRLWHTADSGATWRQGPLLVAGVAAYSDLVEVGGGDRFGVLVETGDRHPFERIDWIVVAADRIGDTADPLPGSFDPRSAVAGRVVVDGERHPIRSLCVDPTMVAHVEADGAWVDADISGGLDDVAVTARLGSESDPGSLTLQGRVALDVEAGISFRGRLAASDGAEREVDVALVNTSPSVLAPSTEC